MLSFDQLARLYSLDHQHQRAFLEAANQAPRVTPSSMSSQPIPTAAVLDAVEVMRELPAEAAPALRAALVEIRMRYEQPSPVRSAPETPLRTGDPLGLPAAPVRQAAPAQVLPFRRQRQA